MDTRPRFDLSGKCRLEPDRRRSTSRGWGIEMAAPEPAAAARQQPEPPPCVEGAAAARPRLPSWVNRMPPNRHDEAVCQRRMQWSMEHGTPSPPSLVAPAAAEAGRVGGSAARHFPADGHEAAGVPQGLRRGSEHPLRQLPADDRRRLPPALTADLALPEPHRRSAITLA